METDRRLGGFFGILHELPNSVDDGENLPIVVLELALEFGKFTAS